MRVVVGEVSKDAIVSERSRRSSARRQLRTDNGRNRDRIGGRTREDHSLHRE